MKDFATYRNEPIPSAAAWSWEKVRRRDIAENGERLVPLSLCPDKILVRPQYFLQNIGGALPECYAREGVLKRLLAAAALLPLDHRLVVMDCWRPLMVQQALFDILQDELRKKHPQLAAEEITKTTLTYVALPSRDAAKPSPHNTGGAVDLTIADGNGLLLEMGTDYDDATDRAGTAYFERRLTGGAELTPVEIEALTNRRLLYHCMTAAGFTNYADEWWHFDYGNQNWAWAGGHERAVYGRSAPQFAWNKEIE